MATIIAVREGRTANPLDLAEQIVVNRNWAFDRPLEDELVVEVSGIWCNYRIWFTWQPDLEALMFSCAYDIKIPAAQIARVAPLILLINERLWLGHFDLCNEDGGVTFRQSMLQKGNGASIAYEQIETLMDLAIEECERFYPAFQSVLWAGQAPEAAIKFAMFDTFGQA